MPPRLGLELARLQSEVNQHIKRWGWPVRNVQIEARSINAYFSTILGLELVATVMHRNGRQYQCRMPQLWVPRKQFLPDPIWNFISREVFHG